MEVRTPIGVIVIVGLVSYLIGCQRGYFRTKEKEDKITLDDLKSLLENM